MAVTAAGVTISEQTYGGTVAAGQVAYLKSDGKWYLARANSTTTSAGDLAIALDSGVAGGKGRLLKLGYVNNPAWSWTPGAPLYLSAATAGGLTQTRPTGAGTVVRIVGYPSSATALYIDPGSPTTIVTVEGLDADAGDILVGEAGAWTKIAAGDEGKVLQTGGVGAAPTWERVARTATYVVAASDAPAHVKRQADYVCDGIDDHVEIQAAIDAASSGGHIHLTEGTFSIAALLELDGASNNLSNLLISGSGRATVLKQATGANLGTIASITGSVSGITLRDLTIDCDQANQASGNLILDIGSSASSIGVERCAFLNPVTTCIRISAAKTVVTGCYLADANTTTGIDAIAIGAEGARIIDNTLYEVGSISVSTGSSQCAVIGNRGKGHSGSHSGIYCLRNSYSNTIVGNAMDGYGHCGIEVRSTGNTIVGNVCRGNAEYGIEVFNGDNTENCIDNVIAYNVCEGNLSGISAYYLAAYTGQMGRNRIVGNVCRVNTQYGILATNLNDCVFEGNIVEDNDSGDTNTYNGIHVTATTSSAGIILRGNQVRISSAGAYQKYGIRINTAAVSGAIIEDNEVSQAGRTANISDAGTGTVIRRNPGYITENKGAAASTADGGTIAHGCATTPTIALVSGSVAGEIVTVTSIDATNITVAIKAADGTTPGTTQTVYWRAEV